MATNANDKLRILIALAVLKNTPKDQTPSTYVSSLKDAFPSSSTINKNFWENHARQLEKDCIELRATLGNLQIRSFLDANADPIVKPTQQTGISALPSSLECSLPVSSAGGKKKSKKKSKSNGDEALEQDSLADVLKQGKTTFGSGTLFQSLDIFLQLWIRHSLRGFQRSGFFVATREVFKALADFFKETTKKQSHLKSMRTLQVALCSVIDKAVPLAASWLIDDEGALSFFFEQLLDVLVTIIIPSFMSVSASNLVYFRKVESSASDSASSVTNYSDARVSILALFQSALVHVRSALPATGGDGDTSGAAAPNLRALARADFSVMIHSLLLADIRHLQDILRDNEGQSVARTRSQRIKRLAVKDTFWYLCSVAHFLLGLQNRTPSALFSKACEPIDSPLRQISLVKLLRQAIIDVMDDLVIYQDRVRARAYTASYGMVFEGGHVPALRDDFGPEFLPSEGASKPMDYVVLDDSEYRMFLRLVERFLDMPSMA